MVLPNATELSKVAKQVRETQHQEWIESIKQTVIDDAKSGKNMSIISDPYRGKYTKEISDIFEPLGYELSFSRYDTADLETRYSIRIMW